MSKVTKTECCIPIGESAVCIKNDCGHWSEEDSQCKYYDRYGTRRLYQYSV